MGKKGFMILQESRRFVERLTNEQAGRLFRAIYDYNEEKEVAVDEDIATEWEMFEFMFDVMKREQKEQKERRAEVNQRYYSSRIKTLRYLKESEGEGKKRSKRKVEEVKVNSIKEKNEKKKAPQFVPPTLTQVKEYVQEKGLVMEAEHFYDHFSSNGWKVSGKATMKDWQAAVRNWARNETRYNQQQRTPHGTSVGERAYNMLHFEYEGHPEMWKEEEKKIAELQKYF